MLWDLDRDRAARLPPRPMPDGGVLLVPGALLQGVGLAFDVVVHLRVLPGGAATADRPRAGVGAARLRPVRRRGGPGRLADAVVLADHADRPALVLAGRFS